MRCGQEAGLKKRRRLARRYSLNEGWSQSIERRLIGCQRKLAPPPIESELDPVAIRSSVGRPDTCAVHAPLFCELSELSVN